MADEAKWDLDETAERFRRSATTAVEASEPSPGTWAAIAAATGIDPEVGAVAGRPAGSGVPARLDRRSWLLAGGALVVGAALGAAGSRLVDSRREEVLGRAVLTPLDQPDESLGRAELRNREPGYALVVEVPEGARNPEGYVEVWLINVDGQRMVSVGVFPANTSATFHIDDALIEAGYLIVDLSNEPFDDEPRHSGDTIMRGELVRE